MFQRTRVPTFCFGLFEDLFLAMVIASFARSSPAGRATHSHSERGNVFPGSVETGEPRGVGRGTRSFQPKL
ncbi:hypothetical protein B296_00054040 [Ensete ventricosum]|uniref:Secreted protein n=1 Tax=Ensete ventricosum TaxID=4639 RepID=A0A426X5G9_ENSVE|nr:hypothetical protein B296_00054040 [Ensete ventricosum]